MDIQSQLIQMAVANALRRACSGHKDLYTKSVRVSARCSAISPARKAHAIACVTFNVHIMEHVSTEDLGQMTAECVHAVVS